MALVPGARFGPYEILSALGAGGMGEVYRARDTKLGRDVALKLLPDAFATDPDRLARFQREAKTLASLNHPHIGGIYGLEETNGVTALVMELVEGDDLAQRLARGALPLNEALPISRQIAEALEAAHEQGIIHRDLKPANIKVRADGTVKVLDFGLAKALAPEPGSAAAGQLSQSPTITSPAMLTGVGMVLGTAAYMSPEQARGKPADKRSDVWAFGCVLYEMLTGTRAFGGDDVSETLANVLKSEPNWKLLPETTPSAIRRLLHRSLAKDRARRLDSAAGARLDIDDALSSSAPDARAAFEGVAPGSWRRVAAVSMAALVVGGAAAATAVWFATRPSPLRVIRTAIPTAGATALSVIPAGPHLTLTPDGSRVVYRGAGQILVRALDQIEPTALSGLGAPQGLFTAPDGQGVGFFDGPALKTVPIAGGPAVTVASLDGPQRGATWGADATIVFATSAQTTGLQRVSVAGGEVTVLTTPDRTRGEADHLWPEFLPDAQAVLFTITAAESGALDAAQIAVLDLRTGTQTVLLRGGSHARYVPTGHLVYGAGGALQAIAFDLRRLTVNGTPVPVLAPVAIHVNGSVEAAVARTGTLVYLSGGSSALTHRTLVWVDRQGREVPLGAPPRAYVHPRLSPDGTRLALNSRDEEQDLWVWDLARTTLTRLTFDPAVDQIPFWTPDSRRLVFSSARAGASNLYVQPADGAGSATRLTDSPNTQAPTGITPDGTRVVFNDVTSTQARDVGLLTLTGTPRVEPLVATRFEERGGVVSPDGRWLAYESNSSGRYEIYVRPFPAVGEGLWQVSTAGGVQPLWAPRGRELFYVALDGGLMGVSVETRAASWSAGGPAQLLEGRYFTGGGVNITRQYDVTADGQRFLMIKEGSTDSGSASEIIVVQHWFEELKAKVPTK